MIYWLFLLSAHEVRNLWLHIRCKTEKIIPEEPSGHSSLEASIQQRQAPCAHYLSITDQLLWSHSSRLQIHPVLVAYSSTISLWDAQTGPRAIGPSGHSVTFTPQQVIGVDSSSSSTFCFLKNNNVEIPFQFCLVWSCSYKTMIMSQK